MHPCREFAGVIGPGPEGARAGGGGKIGELGGRFQQSGNGGGERGGIDRGEGEATAPPRRLAERAVSRTDARFAVREAFDHRQSETLGDGRVNGKRTRRVGAIDLVVGDRAIVTQGATGSLQRVDPRERGASGVTIDMSDQPKFEAQPAGPELIAGGEEGLVVLPALEGADAKDAGEAAEGGSVIGCRIRRGVNPEGKGDDRRRVGDPEPAPEAGQGGGGVSGVGGDAVELKQLLQVHREPGDGAGRCELGEAQRNRVVKQGDAWSLHAGEKVGQSPCDRGAENFRNNGARKFAAQRGVVGATRKTANAPAPSGEQRPVGAASASAPAVSELGGFPGVEGAPGSEKRIVGYGERLGTEGFVERERHALDPRASPGVGSVGEIEEEHAA